MICNKCGCNNECKIDGKCSMAGKTCIDGLDKYLYEHNLEICSTEWLAEHDKQIIKDSEYVKQIIFERDLAIETLRELGGELGIKPEIIREQIRADAIKPIQKFIDDYDGAIIISDSLGVVSGQSLIDELKKVIKEQLKGAENE